MPLVGTSVGCGKMYEINDRYFLVWSQIKSTPYLYFVHLQSTRGSVIYWEWIQHKTEDENRNGTRFHSYHSGKVNSDTLLSSGGYRGTINETSLKTDGSVKKKGGGYLSATVDPVLVKALQN